MSPSSPLFAPVTLLLLLVFFRHLCWSSVEKTLRNTEQQQLYGRVSPSSSSSWKAVKVEGEEGELVAGGDVINCLILFLLLLVLLFLLTPPHSFSPLLPPPPSALAVCINHTSFQPSFPGKKEEKRERRTLLLLQCPHNGEESLLSLAPRKCPTDTLG